MRCDIRILWVEDTPLFYRETREILEMVIDNMGINVLFDYIEDVNILTSQLEAEENGFKKYDIFFIDYSLSRGVLGTEIIKILRTIDIDSDILFYSSEKESEIRNAIQNDLNIFEGVYIANKNNFEEKSYHLIQKNAKRLTSLANIRGFLMDQTSENDFIMSSYVMSKFNGLTDKQKETILEFVRNNVELQKNRINNEIANYEKIINSVSENQMKKIMNLPSYLMPIDLRYAIFTTILDMDQTTSLNNKDFNEYSEKVIKIRNKLAHKKLDICDAQKYIIYSNNIKQLTNNRCPSDCSEHNDQNRISLDEWNEIRENVNQYGRYFDEILNTLSKANT